ncbi:MAG: nucleotidyl transferase AbiEii/AbiGii toxin family protein [Bacteroidales bacterium]
MAAKDFYQLTSEEKQTILVQIAIKLNIHSAAVEKDWWVVQTLAMIQELEIAPYVVFKGGTSLSKAWNIIERFSEDIDLALDKQFLGIDECKTVKQVKKLRSATRKYINETFIPELQEKFSNAGYTDVKVELNEEQGKNLEPVQISVFYNGCTEKTSYTTPQVKVEIGSRSLREPFTNRVISSLVGEHYPDKLFADAPITVPTVNPERTLLEKLFLLHEEFQKPADEIRVFRLSRHLYDVEKLMQTEFIDLALGNKALYNEIIQHRSIYTKIASVDYSLHQPRTLNPIPPDKIMGDWEKDYKFMQEAMIYGKSLPFAELIERIKKLKQEINGIIWSE